MSARAAESHRLDEQPAFAFLAQLLQNRNVKLRVVAQEVVDDVASRSE